MEKESRKKNKKHTDAKTDTFAHSEIHKNTKLEIIKKKPRQNSL